MDKWLSSRRVWGSPRIYHYSKNITPKNGVVSQGPFGEGITGHIEYFYKGIDGHRNEEGGAMYYYKNREYLTTKLWKNIL